MNRVRAADDFETIPLRLKELRRERARLYVEGSVTRSAAPHPEATARQPAVPERRMPPALRRQLRRPCWSAR